MLQPRLSNLLVQIPGLKHGFFTRQGGISQAGFASLNLSTKYGDDAAKVEENKRRVQDFLGASLVIGSQVHGSTVRFVKEPPLFPWVVDGLVTTKKGLALGVLTADCVPVLWADPRERKIAVTHAGWRGTLAGVLQNTRALFKNPPFVAIGPSIQQSSYEVGSDVYQAFLSCDERAFSFFKPHKDLYLFNLPGYVDTLVTTLNVAAIDWIKEDTYTQPQLYFSYRRATHEKMDQVGLMVSAIAWTNNKRRHMDASP